jgi:hypothetical protein
MQVVVAGFAARPHLLIPILGALPRRVRKGTLPEGCRHALGRVNSGCREILLLSCGRVATPTFGMLLSDLRARTGTRS